MACGALHGRGLLPSRRSDPMSASYQPSPSDRECRVEQGVIKTLFPEDVVVEISAPTATFADLMPEERSTVRNAVPKRVAEFATGRVLARRALRRLGQPECAIQSDASMAPKWPQGIVGSISHTHGTCIAALAHRARYRSLGVDVEQLAELSENAASFVCDRDERLWIKRNQRPDGLPLSVLFFSAKESAYKCWFALSAEIHDMRDVRIQLDEEACTFEASLPPKPEQSPFPTTLRGVIRITAGQVFTSVNVPV